MSKKKTNNQLLAEAWVAATVVFALVCGGIAAIWYYGFVGVLCVLAVCVYFWMIDGIYENAKKINREDKKE